MFYQKTATEYILRIRVTPNAANIGIAGIFTDTSGADFLKINLTVVPEKGKANQELIKYLSKKLKIAKNNFTIVSGETDRYKKICLKEIPNDATDTLLNNLENKE